MLWNNTSLFQEYKAVCNIVAILLNIVQHMTTKIYFFQQQKNLRLHANRIHVQATYAKLSKIPL